MSTSPTYLAVMVELVLAAIFASKCGIFRAPSIWTLSAFFFRPTTAHSFYCVSSNSSQSFVDIKHSSEDRVENNNNSCSSSSSDANPSVTDLTGDSEFTDYHCGEKIAKLTLFHFELIFAG